MEPAFALLEFPGAAAGIAAVDRMLKRAPVALVRCGTIHPGRWLVLVGGTVASTEEAHAEALATTAGSPLDEVFLPDPHPDLAAALGGSRHEVDGEALGVLETASSPVLLGALDRCLKATPVRLAELRLADDLGGRALAVLTGDLPAVQAALEVAEGWCEGRAGHHTTALVARLDDTLRQVLGEGTAFAGCSRWTPDGAETIGG